MKKISIFILSICAATAAFLIKHPEPEQIEPVEIIEVPYIIEEVQVNILIAALPPIIEPIVIPEEEEKEDMKTVDEEDLRLLSSIIFAEAGNQCYAGKLGVGIVVMNRVKSEDFPNTIKEVIYQKKPVTQFSPTKNGSYEEALELYDNNEMPEDCILAALSAMDDVTVVEYKSNEYDLKDYLYFGRKTKGYKLQIGLHQFK